MTTHTIMGSGDFPPRCELVVEVTPTATHIEIVATGGVTLRRWSFNHPELIYLCDTCGLPVFVGRSGTWHNASLLQVVDRARELGINKNHAAVPIQLERADLVDP